MPKPRTQPLEKDNKPIDKATVTEKVAPSSLNESFIPKVFQNTEKPEVLTEENIKGLPIELELQKAIASGGTVKLFKLTNPVSNGQKIADKYKIQYDLNTYSKNGVRDKNYRLDSEKKLITQELF